MTIEGLVHRVSETKQVSEKFRTRELVIQTAAEYPQYLSIQFTQDKCDLINDARVGMVLTVHIMLKGREWTSPQGEVKYFNTISGWKVEGINKYKKDPKPRKKKKPNDQQQTLPVQDQVIPDHPADDLPF